MALARLTIDGYGQLELNQVAFRRDGRIEAQCKIAAAITTYIENGMLLAIDKANKTVGYPAADGTDKLIALNYTAEHMYDERTPGLKNFKLDQGTFLPRLGYLAVGDRFTTNCIAYDNTETGFTTDANVKTKLAAFATTPVYGGICTNGAIKVSASKPTYGPVLQVADYTTMPDGTVGVKFVVLAA